MNSCPNGTYVAGWWKCTDYRGAHLCKDAGARYYIDCNRIPGAVFPGGCQCGLGDCNRRRVDCNHFRYGQCNTQIGGTTEVVCRLMVCQNPAQYPPLASQRTKGPKTSRIPHSPCGSDASFSRCHGKRS